MPKRKRLIPKNLTRFNVPCAFGGQASEVAIFIGSPESKHNPIHFQSKFIQGVIPQSVLESLEKLQKLSIENGVPFEELCRYALGSISQQNQVGDESKSSTSGDNSADETSSNKEGEISTPASPEDTTAPSTQNDSIKTTDQSQQNDESGQIQPMPEEASAVSEEKTSNKSDDNKE